MKRVLFLLLIIFFSLSGFQSRLTFPTNSKIRLTKGEKELYRLIMDYRLEKGLPPIPLSKSLTYVAKLHSRDLFHNHPDAPNNCNAHSWSNKSSRWTACCYSPDHAEAACMWNKPRELSPYPGAGYEISYTIYSSPEYHPENQPESALKSWKGSQGHNQLIINKGIWKRTNWQAIGIGIYKNYACVWFGELEDPAGEPE